jgi:hypothetical protein
MSRCRFTIAVFVILLIALHVQVAQAQLKAEPPRGQLKHGQRVLVDDGSCPAGQIKEVIGGSNLKTVNVGCGGLATSSRAGSHRQVHCISGAGRLPRPSTAGLAAQAASRVGSSATQSQITSIRDRIQRRGRSGQRPDG